jgi:branched-chain amino acid transport system permease protein
MTVIVLSQRGVTGAAVRSWPRWVKSYRDIGIIRFAARALGYLASMLFTVTGFISCTEMIQSLSENNGLPVPLSWISADLAIDPHRLLWWIASLGVLLAGVIGLVLMNAMHRRLR